MEIAIAATLYFTFCAFLVLPTLGAPHVFVRIVMGLCASEFVAAVGWGYTRQVCNTGDCPAMMDTFQSAAGLQIPALTGAVFLLAAGYGVFAARNW